MDTVERREAGQQPVSDESPSSSPESVTRGPYVREHEVGRVDR